jgi:hypothetical protein
VVYPDGQVGWFCPLRFDAEPVFWSLLDCSRGGRLAVRPVDDDARADFSYQPGTAVLAYDWRGAHGTARVRLAMAWPAVGPAQELWWVIEGRSGELDMAVDFNPAPGFGAEPVEVVQGSWGSAITTSGLRIDLRCSTPLGLAHPPGVACWSKQPSSDCQLHAPPRTS